ncbi:MAG: hypothetical protein ACI856_002959 [Kiritimatiellia bacterium]|jgi:hypothetical protein
MIFPFMKVFLYPNFEFRKRRVVLTIDLGLMFGHDN